ncbi:putative bacterial alpha-L-rhamnosidase 6 hairpin glycosidase domain-containing protein [Elsinoe australis]|uniref:Putative bacterial alpha-L-rhamnosidase 6 hairpin glycosidase domain-containing protein n=1 Tax=Elsinoe australis TaxID=40998 RepID=A0A4U7AS15_9PEZI|nr:putative bacterial alpha-L-rhamnosidase 6 hairpin glycosidase domain-containing protein [Elsinoe australis]
MATKISTAEQEIATQLTERWIWMQGWIDKSDENTAGRLVEFTRCFEIEALPSEALLHFSADTRYKLLVNGRRVAVGPARGSSAIWYYDSLDIAPFLSKGKNVIKFVVLRYYAAGRAAMPFARTAFPGLTVLGEVSDSPNAVDLSSTCDGWSARKLEGVSFPTGLIDDVFLHINERGAVSTVGPDTKLVPYNIKTLNGELSPWRLRPRGLPMPVESPAAINVIKACDSSFPSSEWQDFLGGGRRLRLPPASRHTLELQADVHSTAFLRWTFKAEARSSVKLKMLYSEGYEMEPRAYPFFRTKDDRLDAVKGKLIGPYDEITLEISGAEDAIYEPFWFRTFRIIQVAIEVGPEPVEGTSFEAVQVNYPLHPSGYLENASDPESQQIWDVSVRTMRNCMFDAYVDCPFYEQLSYIGDSRTVGLFHYLISGDDQLMRRTISGFAISITADGLPQSRFPSQVPQIIAGFALYWILQVCDHYLYFGDAAFAKALLSRIDGVLAYFDTHINEQGLVAGLPADVWQFVDWVTTWGATETHPDKGVPTSGRQKNLHTYFTLLYAYVLREAAKLLRSVGRSSVADEYEARATLLNNAVLKHCYDGQFFTDSTADIADGSAYSQHCQVFAVLAGAADTIDKSALLTKSFSDNRFSKCSYFMMFYAFRAFASTSDEVYNTLWEHAWNPWRSMLSKNLTTWEEDDVRQRSDCHAWGSVPLYEYCTELAGIQPLAAGCSKILFKPRVSLSKSVKARVMLGKDNSAYISWTTENDGRIRVGLRLEKAVYAISRLPGGQPHEHGVVQDLSFDFEG